MPTQIYKTTNGTIVPGTTTVIGASLGWGKDRLIGWAFKRGKEGHKNLRDEVDAACQAGTLAHAAAEAHIKGLPDPPTKEIDPAIVKKARRAFEAYMKWVDMTKLKLYGSEIPLVSESLLYGGTLDAVGEVNGQPALVDFKTSNGTYADHIIQIAAYTWLWEEVKQQELTGGVHLLRFGKEKGNFAHYMYPREAVLEAPFESFKLLRRLFDLRREVEALA
jgi:hypothetical protein